MPWACQLERDGAASDRGEANKRKDRNSITDDMTVVADVQVVPVAGNSAARAGSSLGGRRVRGKSEDNTSKW